MVRNESRTVREKGRIQTKEPRTVRKECRTELSVVWKELRTVREESRTGEICLRL